MDQGCSQADSYQKELQSSIHLRDGGWLDSGSWECGVKILFYAERWDHTHVANVEPSIDKEEISGHNQASKGGRDHVGICKGEEDGAYQNLIRKGI